MVRNTLAFCLLVAGAASADSATRPDQQAVLAAFRRMQEADRKGDGQLWFSLRDRKTLETMDAALKDAIRKGGHSRPSVLYEPLAVRVYNSHAVILGSVTDPAARTVQHLAVLFAIEDGDWKIAREQWAEKPFDPFVLLALLPPEDGAFIRDGAPWKRVAYASNNTDLMRKEEVIWKVQAAFDDLFVYVRFEAAAPLPAPGSKVKPDLAKAGKTGGPPPPPPMRVKVASNPGAEYSVAVTDLVSTSAALDNKGRPAPGRSTVAYSLFVKNAAGEDVWQNMLGDGSSNGLLTIQDRFIDVKVPLAALGVTDAAAAKIDLEEADSMVRILPYSVTRFGFK
jgi:hypothetical protein